jgi:hypothetical protein
MKVQEMSVHSLPIALLLDKHLATYQLQFSF